MYVKEIFISEFRNLKNVKLGPFTQKDDKSELVVLAGPNGSGKTTIMELLGSTLSSILGINLQFKRNMSFMQRYKVLIGIHPSEILRMEKYLDSHPQDKARFTGVMDYVKSNPSFYLASNTEDDEWRKIQKFHLDIKELMTLTFNESASPTGIYLMSDRCYSPAQFDSKNVLEYTKNINNWHFRNVALGQPDLQFKQIFDYLVQQPYHHLMELGLYYKRKAHLNNEPLPVHPLESYNKLLDSILPGYQFADYDDTKPKNNLFIILPSGKTIEFNDLSSGEKEIFFILSFILRYDINNSIILIDEPELHLHPELARRFVTTMVNLKPGNQLWLATQNSEIIDEAGSDRTMIITLDVKTREASVLKVSDESKYEHAMRQFISYSGYIGITKKIVFLEGNESSPDRKLFSGLFPEFVSKMKIIPIGSGREVSRINKVIMEIITNKVGWMQYYLVRDRDFLTEEIINEYRQKSEGRLYILKRCHIENYLVDFDIIAKVQNEIFNQSITPDEVKTKLIEVAKQISGEVLRDMIEFRINSLYHHQDLSIGQVMKNQSILDKDGHIDSSQVEKFKETLTKKIQAINKTLENDTLPDVISQHVDNCAKTVELALNPSTIGQDWSVVFPGKRLLEQYARLKGMENISFVNSLIRQLSTEKEKVPKELKMIAETIVQGNKFPNGFYE